MADLFTSLWFSSLEARSLVVQLLVGLSETAPTAFEILVSSSRHGPQRAPHA